MSVDDVRFGSMLSKKDFAEIFEQH